MEAPDISKSPLDSPQQESSVLKSILTWALILGLAEIVFSLILSLTNQFENRTLGWVMYIIMGTIAYIAVRKIRNQELNGFVSFGKAFGMGFQIIFYAGIIATVYTFFYFKYINPEMINQMLQTAEQRMIERGMPDDQIEAGLKYSRMFMTPGMMAMWGLIGSAITGAILSLIIAAVCRKENKELFPPL